MVLTFDSEVGLVLAVYIDTVEFVFYKISRVWQVKKTPRGLHFSSVSFDYLQAPSTAERDQRIDIFLNTIYFGYLLCVACSEIDSVQLI